MSFFITVVAGAIGSVGFFCLFNGNIKKIGYAFMFGAVSTCVLETAAFFGADRFVSNLLASLVSTLLCKVVAKISKTPQAVFFIASIVPLVPGSHLFYAMYAAINSDLGVFAERMRITLVIGLGISAGILVGTTVAGVYESAKKRLQRSHTANN